MWKGDAAGYKALHLRVGNQRGKPKHCEDCGTTDPAKRYEWANMSGHFADIYDYRRLCKTCHNLFDKRRRPHCKNGHPWTEQTQFINCEGHRKCRICARIQDQRRNRTAKRKAFYAARYQRRRLSVV